MFRYKISIEYDGTGFCGWQKQNGLKSIQGTLETALHDFCGEVCTISVAGRTDAGVHALAQVAHFDLSKKYPCNVIVGALNYHIKAKSKNHNNCFHNNVQPIVVTSSELVDLNFHARFNATERQYQYIILNRRTISPIEANRSWYVAMQLNLDAMKNAASVLIGTHDFSSFRSSECQAKSPIKTLDKICISIDNDHILFNFTAKSFLHHMVRNIVGTLKFIGARNLDNNYIATILDAKSRASAGEMAPSHGLYFIASKYDNYIIYDSWQ